MSEKVVVTWEGQSGKTYRYRCFPIGTKFRDEKPANYIFAALKPKGVWVPVYVGHTENISKCLYGHEKEGTARRYNATYLHVHLAGEVTSRSDETQDIVTKYSPKCNT